MYKSIILFFDLQISLDTIDFAVQRVCEYVNYMEHADLDTWDASNVTQAEWSQFLGNYFTVVHFDGKFRGTVNSKIKVTHYIHCINTPKYIEFLLHSVQRCGTSPSEPPFLQILFMINIVLYTTGDAELQCKVYKGFETLLAQLDD
jgi:hypothetical protein